MIGDESAKPDAEKVDGQQETERERIGFQNHTQHSEPDDFQRQRDKSRECIDCDPRPDPEPARRTNRVSIHGRTPGRSDHSLASDEGSPEQRAKGAAERQERAKPRARHEVEGSKEYCRGKQRSARGTECVRSVQKRDPVCGPSRILRQRPHEERQRHAHEECRPERHREDDRRHGGSRRRPRAQSHVQQVIVEVDAEDREDGHGDFTCGEREEASANVKSIREMTAGEASETEPAHERRHDDGHRVDVCASEERQRTLPDNLIDERGKAAHKKQDQEHEPRDRDTALTFSSSIVVGAACRTF